MDATKLRGHPARAVTQERAQPGYLIVRILNPIALRLRLLPILTVPGRRSGVPRSVPMGLPFELAGTRYLVSPLGETHWVRNLRSARRGQLRIRGRVEDFSVIEATGNERDRIVDAYRRSLGQSSRANFDRLGDLVRPVFEIIPVSKAPSPTEGRR